MASNKYLAAWTIQGTPAQVKCVERKMKNKKQPTQRDLDRAIAECKNC